MSVSDTVRRDSKSYRQGMVLGLTMAETLLLLVFCLLIAAASVIANQVQDSKAEQQSLRDALREAENKVSVMRSLMPQDVITDDWEHLVRDYPHVAKLRQAGVSLKDAGENAEAIAQVLQARKDGLAASDITGSIEVGEAVKKEFMSASGEIPNRNEIVAILREGMQTHTAAANDGGKGEHDWPPIILLSEAKDYHFDSGSAVLSDKFHAALSGPVMNELLEIIAEYPRASVIEVIGHTDEQRIVRSTSNLDQVLIPVLQRKVSVAKLQPADNAGLGLARAVAVAHVLLQDKRLRGYAILPYSGAQLVNVGDTLVLSGGGGNDRERRRIEIRVREPNKVTVPLAASPRAPEPAPVPVPPHKPAAVPRPAQGEIDTAIAQPQQPLPESATPAPAKPQEGPNALFRWFFRN